ncbi:MAG: L-carnitine dehydratase/bile acid-inducible protein F [Anaerolineales bacterium]|nr:L-carnitine dehydratase/bile acid-inducible protein F [Anaerolineales bacterium]
MADLAAGMFAASAILAALYARRTTGEGQRIDISLLDSQVALMSYVASNYLVSGELPHRYGNGHPNIVPYQSFRASDAYFAFAAGNDGQWRKFCQAVDRSAWADDPRFTTNGDRVRHRQALVPMLSELFATRPARAWMDLCQSIGIPAAPINNVEQVFQDPQVQARGLRTSARHPNFGGGTVGGLAPVHSDLARSDSPRSAASGGTHRGSPFGQVRVYERGDRRLAPGGSDLVFGQRVGRASTSRVP